MSSTWDKNKEIEKSVNEFKKTITKDPFKQYLDKNMAENLEDKDKQILFCADALYQGYLDACRTFQRQEKINKIKVENEKPVETENNKLWSIADDIYKYLCDGNIDEFDEQHHNWCKCFMEYQGMKYGQAQKIVNMAFKYMYCIWYGKEEYKEYLEKCEPCHMPLDSFSLEWIYRALIKNNEKIQEYKYTDNKQPLLGDGVFTKNKKCIKKDAIGSWSSLEYEAEFADKCTYSFYNKLLQKTVDEYFRECNVKISPLELDFYVWPRMQKILAAEAFIKAFGADKDEKKVDGSCEISKLDETVENLLKEVIHIVSAEN